MITAFQSHFSSQDPQVRQGMRIPKILETKSTGKTEGLVPTSELAGAAPAVVRSAANNVRSAPPPTSVEKMDNAEGKVRDWMEDQQSLGVKDQRDWMEDQQALVDTVTRLEEDNMEKERCIKELRMELGASSEQIKNLKIESDALCQGLETVTFENYTAKNEFQIVLAAKDTQINELRMELEASHSNAKQLTAELDALREKIVLMEEYSRRDSMDKENCIKELTCRIKKDSKELQASKHEKDALYVALEEAEQAANDLSDSNRMLVEERAVLRAAAPEALALLSALSSRACTASGT
jgi:regulator of replication initiation timing